MLSVLKVETDRPIRTDKKDPKIDQLRAAVVSACMENKKRVGEDAMRWINFRPPPPYTQLPKVAYAHPLVGKPFAEVYAYGEDGADILKKIADSLKRKGVLDIGGHPYRIERTRIVPGPAILPVREEEELRYRTLTPMILFDKPKEHGVYLAIEKKYRESDPERYEREMKDLIAGLMRKSLRGQLIQRAGMADPSFVERVDIEIDDFKFRQEKYHKDSHSTPFLYAAFRSHWRLPPFLGHHTGKGYGMIRERKGAAR